MALRSALETNFDVDYVITYRFTDVSQIEARDDFKKLMQALSHVGLTTEVRNGDSCCLLVFVKVGSEKRFAQAVYRSRTRDWLYGIRTAEPEKETQQSLNHQSLTEAERFRIVHQLITSPQQEGGAGITPNKDPWNNVESIFPLHDHRFNKEWIKKWSTMTFLKAEDLDEIRDRFGEKVRRLPSKRLQDIIETEYNIRLHFTLPLPSPISRSSCFLRRLVLPRGFF
ncbi:MAG: hypothetical protein Q9214_004414 [Letrouitia sp. 1 TL-2023]